MWYKGVIFKSQSERRLSTPESHHSFGTVSHITFIRPLIGCFFCIPHLVSRVVVSLRTTTNGIHCFVMSSRVQPTGVLSRFYQKRCIPCIFRSTDRRLTNCQSESRGWRLPPLPICEAVSHSLILQQFQLKWLIKIKINRGPGPDFLVLSISSGCNSEYCWKQIFICDRYWGIMSKSIQNISINGLRGFRFKMILYTYYCIIDAT